MTVIRWTIASALLLLGALNAYAAWRFTTCTQASADSLYGWIITLPLYVLGLVILPKRGSNLALVTAIGAPAIVITAFVSAWTISLATGSSACALITGLPFEADGREGTFAAAWGVTCLVFWLGFGLALWRAWSSRKIRVEQA